MYRTVRSELHVLIVNCTPHALMYVVSNTIILDILVMCLLAMCLLAMCLLAMCLFSVFLLLLQIHVFDLNMSKYEPLCVQSGEEKECADSQTCTITTHTHTHTHTRVCVCVCVCVCWRYLCELGYYCH